MDAVLTPPISKPPRRRRALKALVRTAMALLLLWIVTFAFAAWEEHAAAAALRARGMPATYEEAVAGLHVHTAGPTSTELLRQAAAENERIGAPGDRYIRTYGKYALEADDNERAFLTDAVARSGTVRSLLDEALRQPPGQFTLVGATLEASTAEISEDIHRLRSIARLHWPLMKEAMLRGDNDEIVRLIALTFRLSQGLAAEEFLMPQLVRIGILGVANGYTLMMIPSVELTEERFRTLDTLLEVVERDLRFQPTLANERAALASGFDSPTRLREDLYGTIDPSPTVPMSWEWTMGAFARKRWAELVCTLVGLPARRRAAAKCLSIPDDVLALVDAPPPWPEALAAKYDQWRSSLSKYPLALIDAPESDGVNVLRNAALYARRRLVMTRLALRLKWFKQRHGRLPDRLNEVCDAAMPALPLKWFEGQPFVYSKDGFRFRIDAAPSVVAKADASLLSREDIRIVWGLLVKLDFNLSPQPKQEPSK